MIKFDALRGYRNITIGTVTKLELEKRVGQ